MIKQLRFSWKSVMIVLGFTAFFLNVGDADAQSSCAVDITCPGEVTAQCTDDLNDLSITGSPTIVSNGCDGVVDVTYSDALISTDGCTSIYARTWVASVGDVSATCVQTITVVDTQGPVFLNAPADAVYTCIGDVPAQPTLQTSDCGGAQADVVFQSETGADTLFCTLTTPLGPGPDWSIWLNGLQAAGLASGDYYAWVPGTATMTRYADGTAYLTGSVSCLNNPSETWTAHFWMQNGRNWSAWSALGRSYKNDLGFGTATHPNWAYYELVPTISRLVGTGSNAGDNVVLSHQPANYYFGFQFGAGANNRNAADGGSGWFFFEGNVNGQYVNNHGDLTTNNACTPVNQPNEACQTSFRRFWAAADNCFNVTQIEQNITVNDNIAPTFNNCPSDVNAECGGEIPAAIPAAELSGTDNCGGPVSITYLGETTVSNGPCSYDLVRAYEAMDECGNRAMCSYTVHVTDQTAPILTTPADYTLECGQELVLDAATATDNCQSSVNITEGEAQYNYNTCGYDVVRTFTATDGCGNTSTGTQTIHVTDTTNPVFNAFDMEVYVECGQEGTISIPTATDVCDQEVTVTYNDVLNSGGCLGVWERTLVATDDCGNQTTAVQYIYIQDNTAPVIDAPANMTVNCHEVPAAPGANGVAVSDNCGQEVNVIFSEEIIPGQCENSYTIVWTWTATDYCENVSTASTTITVVDQAAPEFTFVPAGGTFACDETIVYGEATASDLCDADVTITYADVTTPGLCPSSYAITRTWTATDNCGNSTTASATYTVVDNEAPEFVSIPENITVECNTEIPSSSATAVDNCGEVTVTSSDAVVSESTCETIIERTFTAVDVCGNTSTAVQTITIVDTTAPVISFDIQITRPCDDYSGIYASANDNCQAEVELSILSEELGSGGCIGTLVRVYRATDACGNSSEVTQFISLQDLVAPSVSNAPENVTIECGSEIPAYSPVWSDNCDGELTTTMSESNSFNEETCAQIIVQTYTAIDDCDNTTSVSRTITIIDTTNPWFESIPSSITVNCDEEVPAAVAPAAFDNCDNDVTVLVSEDVIPGDCPNSYTIVRLFRAYDDCGNNVSESQNIFVVDNEAPVFTSVPEALTIECNTDIPATAAIANDACGDVVITSSDAVISESACETVIERTFTAVDACGNSSTATQSITIVDTTAPAITFEAQINRPCDDYAGMYASATDNCQTNVELTIASETMTSGSCGGIVVRVYAANDGCGNVSEVTQYITLIDETAPTIVSSTEDFTVECGDQYSVESPVFSDNCDQELNVLSDVQVSTDGCTTTETYTWTATDACGNATASSTVVTIVDTQDPYFVSLPENITIECTEVVPAIETPEALDACDGEVNVEVTDDIQPGQCPQAYTIARVYRAYDDCGNEVVETRYIYVQDTQAPVLDVPVGGTYSCATGIDFGQATASDACDNEVNITYVDATTPGSCDFNFTVVRTWTATDACGNSASATSTYTQVDDVAPAFTSVPADVTIQCGAEIPADMATASDNCDTDVTVVVSEVTTGDECNTVIVRTFTATDDCGNATEATQTITIIDTTAPIIAGDVQIARSCDNYSGQIFVSATDNCDQEVAIEISEEMIGSGGCAGTVMRTYTATDNCGNSSNFIQYISLTDTQAPVASSNPTDLTIECGQDWSAAEVNFTDNCDDELTVTSDVQVNEDGCTTVYTYTWTAIDHCDNTTTVDQVISIIDTQAPVIEDENSEITIACDAAQSYETPVAYDWCNGDVEVTREESVFEGDCPGSFTETTTFIAIDACGNTATVTHIVHHIDVVAPVLENLPQGGEVSCSGTVPSDMPTASDNCSEAIVNVSEEIIPGTCPNNYDVVRVFSAQDACGNTSDTYTVVYHVTDTASPVFADGQETTYTYECSVEIAVIQPSASDNCSDVAYTYNDQDEAIDGCTRAFNRVWTATDACGNASTFVQAIQVVDTTAPVVSPYESALTMACDNISYEVLISAVDNCNDVTITYNDEFVADLGCAGTIIRTYMVSDACGNMTAGDIQQTITLVDEVAPVFVNVPSDHAFDCSQEVTVDGVEATDNCDSDVAVTYEDVITPGACPSSYSITRTWTATDNCGNAAVATQTITVSDQTAPVFTSVPEGGAYECSLGMPGDMPTAEDNCSDFTISFSDVSVPGTMADPNDTDEDCGSHKTFTQGGWGANPNGNNPGVYLHANFNATYPTGVMIGCGSNTLVFESAQEVTDFLPSGGTPSALPNYSVLTGQLLAATLNVGFDAFDPSFASSNVALGDMLFVSGTFQGLTVNQVLAIANDVIGGCSNAYSASAVNNALTAINENFDNGTVDNGNLDCGGSTGNPNVVCGTEVTRTWTATDACGNASTATAVYFIYDNTAPVFDQTFENITVSCSSNMPSPIEATATDACSNATVTMSSETLESDACGNQVVLVTYVAVDECGNEARAFYTITVNDTEAPVLSETPADLVLDCSEELPAAPMITAVDNCGEVIEVSYTETCTGECPIEGKTNCDLMTPIRETANSCNYPVDWAMALFGMPSSHKWFQLVPGTGSLIDHQDGSLTASGTLVNASNPNAGFTFEVNFANGMDWASWSSQSFPTSFKNDCGGPDNHEDWMYYILQSGSGAELVGWGQYAGSALNMMHAPANNYFGFQMGEGANNYNADNGLGGWFSYNGTFLVNGETIMSGNASGIGDLAFEVDCCPDYQIIRCWTAMDCSGNETSWCQTISWSASNNMPAGANQANENFIEGQRESDMIVGIMPNPTSSKTQISFMATTSGRAVMHVMDMTGRIIADVYNNDVEAGQVYRAEFDASYIPTGMYMVRLTTGSDVDVDRIQIAK
jgi:hypothetical protein